MQIELKLFATLSRYLPAGARRNAVTVTVQTGATPDEVMRRFSIPPEQAHLVIVNGVFVPPEQRERRPLADGDTLALWPPVAGG